MSRPAASALSGRLLDTRCLRPHLLKQNLHFRKIARWFVSAFWFQRHWPVFLRITSSLDMPQSFWICIPPMCIFICRYDLFNFFSHDFIQFSVLWHKDSVWHKEQYTNSMRSDKISDLLAKAFVLLIDESVVLERDPTWIGWQVGVCRALSKGLGQPVLVGIWGPHVKLLKNAAYPVKEKLTLEE